MKSEAEVRAMLARIREDPEYDGETEVSMLALLWVLGEDPDLGFAKLWG